MESAKTTFNKSQPMMYTQIQRPYDFAEEGELYMNEDVGLKGLYDPPSTKRSVQGHVT